MVEEGRDVITEGEKILRVLIIDHKYAVHSTPSRNISSKITFHIYTHFLQPLKFRSLVYV